MNREELIEFAMYLTGHDRETIEQMMEESGYKKPGTVARKEFEKWIEVYLKRKKLGG